MKDVIVVGGGSAGLAAAVSAARAGARTLLLDRTGFLGGMGSIALVHTICGLYRLRSDAPVFANPGFASEFATRLLREGGAREPAQINGLFVMPHDPLAFASLADAYVTETPGLEVWLHAELCSASLADGYLEVVCRGTKQKVSARAFVDATGDAALLALAGADFVRADSERLQRPAYIVGLIGTPDLDTEERLRLAHAIANAVKAGNLPGEALGTAFRCGGTPGKGFMTVDLAAGGGEWDPDSPSSLTQIELTGRRTVRAVASFLASTVPGWEGVSIAQWPMRTGVRESRRACGAHELSGEEVLNGVQFDDAIAEVAWPMELREQATGPRWRHSQAELPAQIPLRSLRHRSVKNLWTAGRCLSCDHEAQAAIRVMGTCFATGEAAGIAAALDSAGESNWDDLAGQIRKMRPC